MNKILQKIQEVGGNALIVGGYVRDKLLGLSPKDMDIEVYGLKRDKLGDLLSQFGKVDYVGKSFGIFKICYNGRDLDFSIPRREKKVGSGHCGFDIEVDPHMSVEQAAARRDFTINAMACNPLTGEIIDPFGGRQDLIDGILRPTSSAFNEDPLRILRAMQFCSRFCLTPHTDLIQAGKGLQQSYVDLPAERVYAEWVKWSISPYPAMGLNFLRVCGWLKHFPVLFNLLGCEQDPTYHPEGNCWGHTLYVCNEAALIGMREGFSNKEKSNLVFAALLHDVGKPSTTFIKEGRIVSPGHDVAGEPLAASFMESLNFPHFDTMEIKKLVRTHMVHCGGVSPRKARRLVHLAKPNFKLLWALIEADHSGRPPLPKGFPAQAQQLKELVEAQQKIATAPLVMGRHLIEKGWTPGKEMGNKLRELYSLQIEAGLNFDQLMERLL